MFFESCTFLIFIKKPHKIKIQTLLPLTIYMPEYNKLQAFPSNNGPFRQILLTGATGGLGKAVAQVLARQGHELLLVSKSLNLLNILSRIVDPDDNGHVKVFCCDFSNPSTTDTLGKLIKSTPVDCVVNNAGVAYPDEKDIRIEELEEMWRVNVVVPMALISALLSKGSTRRPALVINMLSTAVLGCPKGFFFYSETKRLLHTYSRQMMRDYLGKIQITNLFLGSLDTNFSQNFCDRVEHKIEGVPMLKPEIVADYVGFLIGNSDKLYIAEAVLEAINTINTPSC